MHTSVRFQPHEYNNAKQYATSSPFRTIAVQFALSYHSMENDHNRGDSIRAAYEQHGVDGFYRVEGDNYRNPHEPTIRRALAQVATAWSLDLAHVLDLACGSGEATLALRALGANQIDGIDPYTGGAYQARTGEVAKPYTFAEIAAGVLAGRSYSLIVCSFALHLAEQSRLPLLCYRLAEVAPSLLILTPHKRPMLDEAWGWKLREETVIERVRVRLYERSTVDDDTPSTP